MRQSGAQHQGAHSCRRKRNSGNGQEGAPSFHRPFPHWQLSLCFASVSLDKAEHFLHSRRTNVHSLRKCVGVHPECSSASARILNSDSRNWVPASTPCHSRESDVEACRQTEPSYDCDDRLPGISSKANLERRNCHAPSLSNASPAGVALVRCALPASSKASSNSPPRNALRAASRSRHASAAIRIRRARSAPHREQTAAPRKRAWQTGQRFASAKPFDALNSGGSRLGLP